MMEGVAGLLRDKTRPSRIPPLTAEVEADVVSRTLAKPTGETTHWTAPAMAKMSGISCTVRRHRFTVQAGCGFDGQRFALPTTPQPHQRLQQRVHLS